MTRRLLGFLLFVTGLCAFALLQHPIPSAPLLETHLQATIRFSPAFHADKAFLVSDQALFCLNNQGQTLFRVELTEPRSGPVFPDNEQLVLLTGTELRSFAIDQGKARWAVPHQQGPGVTVAVRPGKILTYDSRLANVFDGTSKNLGQWQPVGTFSQVLFGNDDILVGLVQTQTATETLTWRVAGYSLSKAAEIWRFPEPLTSDPLRIDQGQVLCCTASGQPVLVDQETGKELFRIRNDGYRLFENTPSSLILLAAGASRLETRPLSSGGASWSVSSSSPIHRGIIIDSDIVLLDEHHVRVFALADGEGRRQFQPGSVLRDGGPIAGKAYWITYEDSLWWNSLFCSVVTPTSGKLLWTAGETKEGVWPPLALSSGDLLVSRNGRVRLFARSHP